MTCTLIMDVEKEKFEENKKKNEEMAERFKAADCKSVEFLIAGSNPAFFKIIAILNPKCNAAVACLLWEQKVMCSNHIISKNIIRILVTFL